MIEISIFDNCSAASRRWGWTQHLVGSVRYFILANAWHFQGINGSISFLFQALDHVHLFLFWESNLRSFSLFRTLLNGFSGFKEVSLVGALDLFKPISLDFIKCNRLRAFLEHRSVNNFVTAWSWSRVTNELSLSHHSDPLSVGGEERTATSAYSRQDHIFIDLVVIGAWCALFRVLWFEDDIVSLCVTRRLTHVWMLIFLCHAVLPCLVVRCDVVCRSRIVSSEQGFSLNDTHVRLALLVFIFADGASFVFLVRWAEFRNRIVLNAKLLRSTSCELLDHFFRRKESRDWCRSNGAHPTCP